MKLVIYSSNSNYYDSENFSISYFPSCKNQWEELLKQYKNLNIVIVSKIPSMFLIDFEKNKIKEKAKGIEYYLDGIKDSPEQTAKYISDLNPDLAIAASFWVNPFDWLSINDSLIGQYLEEKNIKTIYHPLETVKLCFDKNQTYNFLCNNNFNCAKAIYVHHELFWAERNHLEIKDNYYKIAVLDEIKHLNYPVIIKDTTGLSSYGMEVVKTFGEAKNFLTSKKNNSDRLVEEFIKGTPFGVEIWGCKDYYFITPPLEFSTNKYGITSPKQSKKSGPVSKGRISDDSIQELNKEILRLADLLHFNGIAQVDLIFEETSKKWFIIEINPRISGMTQTYAAMYRTSLPEILLNCATKHNFSQYTNPDFVINTKIDLLPVEKIENLQKLPFVKYISQTENKAAKQEREKGYCEVIVTGENKEELEEKLNQIH